MPATQKAEPAPKRGIVHLIDKAADFWRDKRPDYTRKSFEAAVDEALQLIATADYFNMDEIVDEIAELIGGTLRSGGVTVTHIANIRATGESRLKIRTAWGLTARVNLGIKFASKPGVLRS